jgi:hypothetical protein
MGMLKSDRHFFCCTASGASVKRRCSINCENTCQKIAASVVEHAASLFETSNGQAARSTENSVEHAASLFGASLPLRLNEARARDLISEPVKEFYSYESPAVDLILQLSELRPFTIQGFCLRAVNRILADGRTRITVDDIQAIKESVLAEVASIRGERAGTSLPASLNGALAKIADLEAENKLLREEAA